MSGGLPLSGHKLSAKRPRAVTIVQADRNGKRPRAPRPPSAIRGDLFVGSQHERRFVEGNVYQAANNLVSDLAECKKRGLARTVFTYQERNRAYDYILRLGKTSNPFEL